MYVAELQETKGNVMETMPALERCPRCGSGAPKTLPQPNKSPGFLIMCRECGHTTYCKVELEAYAVYKWNKDAEARRRERIENQMPKKTPKKKGTK